MWSERHALRDEVTVIVLAICAVLVMAVAVIVLAHAWTAGSATGIALRHHAGAK